MEGLPLGRVVYKEADLWQKVLYQVDTVVEGLLLGRMVYREIVPEDTSPYMVLLQDRGSVLGKATALDTVLERGNLRVEVP